MRRNNTLIAVRREGPGGGARRPAAAAWMLAAALATACGGPRQPELTLLSGPTMGTRYQVQLVAALEPSAVAALHRDLDGRLAEIEAQMSSYRPESDLSRFNASHHTDWVPMPAGIVELAAEALEVSRLSDGAFDPTVAALVDLWGFGPGAQARQPPAAAALDGARARVGYRHLALRREPPALRKARAGLRLDLSGIAKGHAVDQLAELLLARGVGDFLVEIGGELRAAGRNASGVPWRVAVERPDSAEPVAEAVLELDAAAVATSGDYRNYFEVAGKRYAHVIDPRTGWPADHGLASVTVVATTCAQADAWATALLVLGPEAGLALAERRGLAALLIVREGGALVRRASAAFADRWAR